jgi:hypothetical protein
MNESFSSSRKQRIVALYTSQFKELVRAYLYNGDERISFLISYFLNPPKAEEGEVSDPKINKGDLDLMISMAQDFVAIYRLMELDKQKSSVDGTDTRLRAIN